MIRPGMLWAVARYESRLLWRSWAFRLSALVAVGFLLFFNIILTAPFSGAPLALQGFSAALPLTAVKLLNLYLGLIGALLATEFVKRDRQLDSAQTVFVNSYSNAAYVIGKMLGIGFAIGSLVIVALLAVGVNHRFFADAAFAWQPYLLFPLLGTLPTLTFTIGVACLLVTVLRSQALVLVLMLGLAALTLFGGERLFRLFDTFAFWLPLSYSDFVGSSHLDQLLTVRGTHALVGLACMAATALLSSRLRQSWLANVTAAVLVAGGLGGAVWLGKSYLDERWSDRALREQMAAASRQAASLPAASVTACDLQVEHDDSRLAIAADLRLVNRTPGRLDSLLFSLNPGLSVSAATVDGRPADRRRDLQLLYVHPQGGLAPGDSCRVQLSYEGAIDERAAYLDIEAERLEQVPRFWLFRLPKQYAFVSRDYLHLTPEVGWYPVSGVPPGAAFPEAGHRDYTMYSTRLQVPPGWQAFSQGAVHIDSSTAAHEYRFRSDVPLPQISLTAGPYSQRQIRVDDATYTLAVLPGHEYFDTYLDSLDGVLPELIGELRNDYEAALGLDYPYSRLSLVEVPLPFYAYRRLWTVAQESVQPEIVFLPEMGVLCEGSDFKRLKRRSRWSQESANQAESAQDLQSEYLRTFVNIDLLGTQDSGWSAMRDGVGLETRFYLLPNSVSFATHLASGRWPVLNAAVESYFQARLTPPQNMWIRRVTGLSESERANLALKEHSLEQLLAGEEEMNAKIHASAIRAKSRQLMLLFAAAVGPERFAAALNELVGQHGHRNLSEADLLAFLADLGNHEAEAVIETWYRGTELPGYEIGGADAYLVRDGERTRTQVELELGNPTQVDGVVEIYIRFRESDTESWWSRNSGTDFRYTVAMPAGIRKEVGLVLDARIAEVIVDTHVSRNLPAQIQVPLEEAKLRLEAEPFAGERTEALEQEVVGGEYVVDNEDVGFVMVVGQPNWLRRLVVDVFDLKEREVPYIGFRPWHEPGNWEATTNPSFYGRFVLSGYYKRVGDGRSRVSWRTEIEEDGEYEVYYYLGEQEGMRGWRHRSSDAELEFQVYHEDGVEASNLEIAGAEDGWNLLGTYPLAAGPAHVELSDRGPERIVIADAVKWVKRN